MENLIQALGIDWRILIAQFVNFAILVFILWKFAYTPILKILEERREKIAQSLKDSEESQKKLADSLEESKKIILEARQEASDIVKEAQDKGEVRYQEIVAKAKADLRVVMNTEKEKLLQEKQELLRLAKKELADLVTQSLEKFLSESLDEDKDKRVIEEIIKNV